ncbi:uncharacterized protein LOC116289246 [Actinia tenebrosa]|uniref:Uncharacterized protein LOC116289246 n=1 Tax=Actinia tenebrosa TaxID=6105 RepID=A0A6P8HHE3_ACTTE|nr:uncharacterized protein LOC116289246 [Actinia tenebrosa]
MAQPSKYQAQKEVRRWNVKAKYGNWTAQNPRRPLGPTLRTSSVTRPPPSIDTTNPASRKSSLDSLVDSDFSDTSFYDFPSWFAKNPKKTSLGPSSTVGVVVPPYHSESFHAHAFPEHRFQGESTSRRSDGRRPISGLSKYPQPDPLTSEQKPLQQYYRPYYNQFNPYSTMNNTGYSQPLENGSRQNGTGQDSQTQYHNGRHGNYSAKDGQQNTEMVQEYVPLVAVSPDLIDRTRSPPTASPSCSPESDDTLARSSSGFASDIESPRSLKSCLVETPRGLVQSAIGVDYRGNYSSRDNSFKREHLDAKTVSFSKNGVSEKHLNGGHGLGQAPRESEFRRRLHSTRLSSNSTSSAIKPYHVQSNVVDSNGSLYSYDKMSSSLPYTTASSQLSSSIYHPQSPPTRDASKVNTSKSLYLHQNNSSVPAMSLFEETGMVFGKHLVQTPSRNLQSNLNGGASFEKDKQTNMYKLQETRYNNELVLNNGMDATRRNKQQGPPSKQSFHSLNNGKRDPTLPNHVSLVNSFSVDTSRRISSAVWAMKVLEAEQTTTPALYQQLLLKARLFRRWHQRARLRRLERMESDNKMNKAVEFWRGVTLHKHLSAWKELRHIQETKADDTYRRHMLETGLRGLKFATHVNSQARRDVETKINGRLMAKYWLKWQGHMMRRRGERMRSLFNRWRVFQLEGNREKILDGMANKHFMSRKYVKWKMRYQVEQNNSVARLNFKITLLTKCWHSWRIYTAQRIVKTRTNEVARIHYENNLQTRVFLQWLEGSRKSSIASNLSKRRIVVKAFYSWRNWTEYAKVIHQRFQSMCKEYYNKSLVKQTFIQWKRKLMVKQAENFHGKLLQKRVYRLWFLRYRRKVIHRHLCKAMARKGKKRRFFRKLLEVTRSQRERRNAFVGILQKLLLTKMMKTWREHTIMKKSLRIRYIRLIQIKESRLTVKAMNQWLFAMKVANFKKQAKINWSKRCTRKACEEWKLLLKRKHLEETLIESRPTRDTWILRVAWNTWMKKKKIANQELERVITVKTILARNFKRRILQAWRVTNQQQQIIAPMVQRRERKHIARAFDAWRLYLHRQKYIVNQQSRGDEKLVDRHFLYWRDRVMLRIKERNAVTSLQNSKLTRAFKAWQAHVREIRHQKLKERAERLQLLSVYFNKWTISAEARAEEKEQRQANQARKVLLVRWGFRYWKESSERQRLRLNLIEEEVTSSRNRLALKRFFDTWKRWFTVANIARDHIAYRRDNLLRTAFTAWGNFIKQEINEQVNRFSTGLSLDCSMGSNMGSLLRSTMDSSASDYLSSSGYGTSFRRGSGSVFPLRSPGISQRDDDIASLPGRFDQLHPDSPRRVASPITVLRESNHVVQVTSPLVVQTPTSSPSPSPPDLHLSLPLSVTSYESVFSPVKDKEFLLAKPDSFEMHRSISLADDDEFEHMSMTSGMSSASVRDKEMVIIDTILHWRSLPLSLTFRSWLKYTREQKLLRDLLFYSKEKKTREIIAGTMKRWRRELYIKVAARQYLRDGTRLRCLRAWHLYVKTRRMKERRNADAKNLNRSFLIKRFFDDWKNKYTAKKRLQTIVVQWQKKAIITDKHKAIGEKVQMKHDQQALRRRFYYWVKMTRKSQEARRFYLERLLPRFFISWHLYSSARSENRKKGAYFNDRRILAMAFREWQEQFISERKAKDFLEAKEIECSLDILRTWHEWANGVRTRRVQWRNFHRSLEIKTMKGIFSAWREQVLQREHAEQYYHHTVMRKVLLSWRRTVQASIENRLKASALKESCSNNLLKRSFTFWRRLYLHRQLALSHAQQKDRDLLRERFLDWRDYTLESRAEKHYLKAMVKKVYYRWYDEYLSRKKARRLLRSWKSITEDSKALNSKAMELCQLSEKKVLHQTFTFWMQEAHKIQKAKLHYATNTTRSSLKAWFRYAHTKTRCRKTLADIEASRNQDLISRSFFTWRDRFTRNASNQEILDEHLRNKQFQSLESCMLKWHKYTLNCRALKHHDGRLQYMSLMKWRLRLSQKKGLEKIMERVFYRRIRQAAVHWRQWTVKTKREQARADEFQFEMGNRHVRVCFAYWVNSTEQSTRAKDHHNNTVLKRSLMVWQSVITAKIKQQKIMEKFQKEVMAKKVGRMFKEWRAALKQAQKHNQLVSIQMSKHNKLVLQGCMRQWKKYIQKCRADKHFNIVLTARFFLNWKSRFNERMERKQKEKELGDIALDHYHHRLRKLCFRSWYYDVLVGKHLEMKQQQLVHKHFHLWKKKQRLKTIASELGDRQLYSKYWGKWRNQLVRKRVSELMMKHEEKKLLSEVFGAWYKLTMIRRRLLMEWNIAVVEKWFRKWMQKYNES